MKRILTILIILLLTCAIIAAAPLRQKVLIIRADEDTPGQFQVDVPELSLTFPCKSVVAGFDRAVREVTDYEVASTDIDAKIAEIDRQLIELTKQREALEDSKRDQLKVSAILDETEQKRYRSVIKVLYEETAIEKAMNSSVVAVAFIPDTGDRMYGVSLTWMWYFNRYFE